MNKPKRPPTLARLDRLIQKSNQRNEFLEQCLQSLKQSIEKEQVQIEQIKQEYKFEVITKDLPRPGDDLPPTDSTER